MSDARLLVHDVSHPTVTLFVDPGTLRDDFLADHPEEDGVVLTVRIDAPDGVEIEPSAQSNLSQGHRRSDDEFILIADEDGLQRASFNWSVIVPDRSHLDEETITVTLYDHNEQALDHANVLI